MSHIFISYSRKDIDFAQKIVNALATNDLNTWIDWKNIPKGEDWEQEIYRGIEEADAFLFLISLDSVISEMCNKEITHAVANGKRILPIVIRDADEEKFLFEIAKEEISKRNWIFCREGQDDFEIAIAEIRQTIHTDYEWLKYHTRLQVKALEWKRTGDNSRLLRGKELREAEEKLTESVSVKDPQPTNLHREYFLVSTKDERHRRSWIIAISVVTGIVMVVLGIYAQFQGNLATDRATTAQAASTGQAYQAQTAQAASTLAIANEAIALAEKERAEVQARISRAGELAALAISQLDQQLDLALLLSVEAFYTHDMLQTNNTLFTALEHNPKLDFFLQKHSKNVTNVAWSPDGLWLASASTDNTVIVWDTDTGQPHQILEGHESWVKSVAWSPDRQLASVSQNGKVILWNLGSGRPLRTMQKHIAGGYDVAWSLDGQLASSGCAKIESVSCAQGEIIIWDLENGIPQKTLLGHQGSASSIAWSPNGRLLASASSDESVILWDTLTGQISQNLQGHTDWVESVAWSQNGQLASASGDGTIIIWDSTGQPLKTLKGEGWTDSLAWSIDGKLASDSTDNNVFIWDPVTDTDQPQQILEGHTDSIRCVSWSPDGTRLASSSRDGKIILWDLNGQVQQTLRGHKSWVDSVAWSPNNQLASGARDGKVILWNLESGQPQQTMQAHTDIIYSMAWSPDGQLASSSCADFEGGNCVKGEIIIWDLADSSPRHLMKGHTGYIQSLAWSPVSDQFATGAKDGVVIVWDANTGQIQKTLRGHNDGVWSVTWSSEGLLASSSCAEFEGPICRTGEIIIWNLWSNQPLHTFKGHSSWIYSMAWSPNEILASSSWDNTIVLWNSSGIPQQTFQEYTQDINASWSKNGQLAWLSFGRMVSVSDHEVIIWDLKIGLPQLTMQLPKNLILSVACSNDEHLAVGLANGLIQVWNMNAETWIARNCQRAGRNFTQAEWQQYFPGEEYRITCPQWPAGE